MINNSKSINNQKSIRRTARVVQAIALIGMALLALIMVAGDVSFTAGNEMPPRLDMAMSDSPRDHLASLPYRLSGLAALLFLFRLFGRFANGDIFTDLTVRNLRRLSLLVVAVGLNKIGVGLYAALYDLLFSAQTTPDLNIDVTGGSLGVLVVGLLLYAFALIQQEAKTQTEDLRLIF